MARRPGVSVRLRLALSYAGFLVVAGTLLLAVVWVFLLRYVPPDAVRTMGGFVPGRDDLIRAFAPKAAWAFVSMARASSANARGKASSILMKPSSMNCSICAALSAGG